MTDHLDEFALLCHTVKDLSVDEEQHTERHLAACTTCRETFEGMRLLDPGLRQVIRSDPRLLDEPSDDALPTKDAFHHRPTRPAGSPHEPDQPVGPEVVLAAEAAIAVRDRALGAMADASLLRDTLRGLEIGRAADRFGALYALQEASHHITESPGRAGDLAAMVLDWLGRRTAARVVPVSLAERAVPLLFLRGQAHELAAQAYLWTKEFARARRHLVLAYHCIGWSTGDETSLAIVELVESQRRSFTNDGKGALLLAARAHATFESLGLEDLAARATVGEGLALFILDRQEDAVAAYRRALPVFAQYELWTNYVTTLNSIGTSLHRLGRLAEARREYARALQRFSREEHRSVLGFVHHGLADLLSSAGRYEEAAIALSRAAGSYLASDLPANALIAMLCEVENWARSGQTGRANARLDLFHTEAGRHDALDPAIRREIKDALTGANPDFERLAALREQLAHRLQDRLRARPA
jgi:tetratricopeptide (TPR) repeat protein